VQTTTQIPKEVIIIGGGPSIKMGINLGLKEKIKNKFVVACNFACHHFKNTFTIFADKKVWNGKLLGSNLAYTDTRHIEIIRKQPLLITIKKSNMPSMPANVIVLKKSHSYEKENSVKKGFLLPKLTGIFALEVACFLLDYSGKIFLLGYDWPKGKDGETETHYYSDKEINHKGQHLVHHYNNTKPKKHFDIFLKNHPKIYNVSPNSNITCFEKINYPTFFSKIKNVGYNQNELRAIVRNKLTA